MFEKILIANRGEIALRIQRACREMGIRTVVVHSEADTEAKYVKLADESVCIGPPPAAASYLNIPAIISAAMVTGFDLVQEQIYVAAGEKLRMRQKDIAQRGHAIECRINAEDPYRFTPSPGKITSYHPPGGPGIRVDSHVYQGYTVPPYYDSMVGKVIAYGASREQAIGRMRIALSEMVVEGILTNLPLHRELLDDTRVLRGGVSIHYLEQKLAQEQKKKK